MPISNNTFCATPAYFGGKNPWNQIGIIELQKGMLVNNNRPSYLQ